MELGDNHWRGRTVCVTGGTGFLGFHLAMALRSRGARVRVFGLAPRPGHPLLACRDVELIAGDIRDRGEVRRALEGCDVVFHAAGIVSVWGPALQRMWAVHVDGTRNVLETAPSPARIVHTSSVVAVGASRSRECFDETSPFNLADCGLVYCQAKRAAEEVALASGRDVVVTNPGYLVGPDDHEPSVMGRLCFRYWRGRLPLAPPGGVNFADVRDVANGHLLAAQHGQAGRRYILGGENHTFSELLPMLAAAGNYAPRGHLRIPYWMLAALGGIGELHGRIRGKEPYPSLGHVRVNRYCWFYRSDRAQAELGFRSRPLTETLADLHRWFRSRTVVKLRGINRWWLRPAA